MSNLSEAISEMRNMRESYDQIGAAAEAYNTGKVQLAQNISSKGVPASASETLPELAEKVSAIAQESYTIQGGEMYAKQLFGSLETPNYWNLYDVLAQLLSDGRLVNYGGILLAEYYKGYNSLALSGAGAGGAYVVSDKDENGQFKMYTEDTTHVWNTEFDGKGNRWVAYCFADEYHDFQITDTNTSPRSIFIGRKVGTIRSLVAGRVSQIIIEDGNKLDRIDSGTYAQNWDRIMVLRNLQLQDTTIANNPNSELIYIDANKIADNNNTPIFSYLSKPKNIIIKANEITCNRLIANMSSGGRIQIVSDKIITAGLFIRPDNTNGLLDLNITTEECRATNIGSSWIIISANGLKHLYLGYLTNNKERSVIVNSNSPISSLADVELQYGYCKPMSIVGLTDSLTEENMYAHILQRLKQDEPDCGDGVTITLGATNLAKLTSEESVQLLDDLTNIYGYTFA